MVPQLHNTKARLHRAKRVIAAGFCALAGTLFADCGFTEPRPHQQHQPQQHQPQQHQPQQHQPQQAHQQAHQQSQQSQQSQQLQASPHQSSKLYAASDCARWMALPGHARWVPAFPDKASHYFSYAFETDADSFQTLQIQGALPQARYFSINVYETATGQLIGGLNDEAIKSDLNPNHTHYLSADNTTPQNPHSSTGPLNYTLYLSQADRVPNGNGLKAHNGGQFENRILIPKTVPKVSIIIRTYLLENDRQASIHAFLPRASALGSKPVTCPRRVEIGWQSLSSLLGLIFFPENLIALRDRLLELQTKELIFVRGTGDGLFPNADAGYLFAPLDPSVVTILRFKAPSFSSKVEHDALEVGANTESSHQTRYWSVCAGSLAFTTTSDCIYDSQLTPDPDGFVSIVIGREEMRPLVQKAGLAFVGLSWMYKPIVIYRHLLDNPNFSGRFSKVPAMPPLPSRPANFFSTLTTQEVAGYSARDYLGQHAPIGRPMPLDEFKQWIKEIKISNHTKTNGWALKKHRALHFINRDLSARHP